MDLSESLNTSFSSKFCFAHQATSLFQTFGFVGGLEPSDHFWGNWVQNDLSAITLEPHMQFSQTTPNFVRNFVSHTKLPVCFRHLGLLGAWNLVCDYFWGNWAKNRLSAITLEPHIQFSQTTPHFVRNFVSHTKLPVYFRYLALLGAWILVTTFGAIGPKLVYLTLLWSHTFK